MSRRVALSTLPILKLGQHYVDFNLQGGQLHKSAPQRIEDIPVSEMEVTGQQPIFDRIATGGVRIDAPPIPTVPEKIHEDEIDQMDEILAWWKQESAEDAEQCLAKLIEYGSSDFDIMAQTMLAVGGAIWSGVPDAERMRVGREMAICFYLQGKIARAFGAFEKGRMPSDDTLDDITRYGMMLKRVRQTGVWG